ncbi:MAG: hypothetical protein HOP15_16735, partial [Planctomycetes bacterium]|nr:hypothetical protein [Planctomycetota bacterium]
FHPAWYLDPSQRPAVLFDLEPALTRFAARFPETEWSAQRMSLQSAQIEAALALLPPETVQRVSRALRASRAISLQPSAAPDSKMVVLAAMEFESAAAALDYLDAARALADLKAEHMQSGPLRILASERSELARPDLSGFLARIRMRNGAFEFEMKTLDAARGSVVVETVFSAEPIEDAALAALGSELLDAVARLADAPAPR